MRIAFIVPYPILPADEGGRVRALNLIQHLALQHDLLLVTPRSSAYRGAALPAAIAETTAPGRLRQILDPGSIGGSTWGGLRDFRPDVIVSEYPWTGLRALMVARRLGVPFVLDAPNVEGDRFRRSGSRTWRVVDLYERLVARGAAAVFAVSDEDAQRFRDRGVPASKVQVVPNGVDPARIRPDAGSGDDLRRDLGVAAGTKMLLFFGQLGYTPNREALHAIHAELLPRLDRAAIDYTFIVCGKNHESAAEEWSHPRLRYTGAVPDVAPYINAADAVAVPVTSGGGTRLKILESVACATPVVSTTLGAEGIDHGLCGPLLIVVDGWDAFAEALARPREVKLGNAPAAFLDMYSWAGIVSRIEWPT